MAWPCAITVRTVCGLCAKAAGGDSVHPEPFVTRHAVDGPGHVGHASGFETAAEDTNGATDGGRGPGAVPHVLDELIYRGVAVHRQGQAPE